MATYVSKLDKRNTSAGMTPNKSIRRPTNPAPKKPAGMMPKKMTRRPQGK